MEFRRVMYGSSQSYSERRRSIFTYVLNFASINIPADIAKTSAVVSSDVAGIRLQEPSAGTGDVGDADSCEVNGGRHICVKYAFNTPINRLDQATQNLLVLRNSWDRNPVKIFLRRS